MKIKNTKIINPGTLMGGDKSIAILDENDGTVEFIEVKLKE